MYLNDGKAHFTEGQSLQFISDNASCIAVQDIDNDGYADVFIGGRGVAGNYGKPGKSYLLHNDHGILKDITPAMLKTPGMVTDACWTDINNDGFPDLMLVGEWMPVTFYLNEKGTLSRKQEVANSAGWWNVIRQEDLDKDGDMDFVLGNWGLNSRFKASQQQPMQLYLNDFDDNGTSECVITYFWADGKSHLYPTKNDITSQIPALRKDFLLYKDYAGKSAEDILGKEALTKSQQLKTEELRSSILWNDGKGNFQLKAASAISAGSACVCHCNCRF